MNDQQFDARFSGLRDIPPPSDLARRTLAAVAAEQSDPPPSYRRPRRVIIGWGLAAAAAAVLLTVPAVWPVGTSVGDPAELVAKGSGEIVQRLEIRGAVRKGDSIERIAAGVRYDAGDTLLFRVITSDPMTLSLSRNGLQIWQGPVPAGESDLPVGYTLEAGDGEAVFEVSAESLSARLKVLGVAP